MSKSIVLIGDIEGSKELDSRKREEVQQLLKNTLENINTSSDGGGLLSPHTITLGDEFQAVYEHAGILLRHTWQIMAELHPVQVRFSMGIGTITTPINREQSIGMDGPAFHTARDGIEQLKDSELLYQLSTSDPPESSAALDLINGSLHLVSRQMRGWKKTRFYTLYMLDQGVSVKEIAGRLDISESAVYKNREGGSLDVILRIKNSITSLINEQLL